MGNVEYSEFQDAFWISGLWTKFYIESFSSFGVHPFSFNTPQNNPTKGIL